MIRFEDVSFRYLANERGAGVDHVTFDIPQGECVLICGASGSGKTTLARLANGLAPSFLPGELTGRVLVDGDDLTTLTSWQRAERIGSVFQNPKTQFFNTDVASEVAFGMESLAWPETKLRRRCVETMTDLGLASLAGRNLFSLSGGQKQRVAFASVYAPRPGNFVLDEPTSNLDAASVEDLRGHIRLAKEQGATIMVAEHRLHWLKGIVDRVIWLSDGQIGTIYSADQFWALTAAQRAQMGPRCADLSEVEWSASEPDRGAAPREDLGLEAMDLRASYGRRHVLTGVDLSIATGEVVALTGSNGAGKSTLSRLLCGLHRKGSGQVVFGGQQWRRQERLRRSAMVFQDVNYQLFAESVAAEVTFGLDGISPEVVAGLLVELGLEGLDDRHPATLSGGQKQRLAVAASLAAGKRVLVFDEPTSGLDLAGMERVAGLLRRFAGLGNIVLVATHDLEFICRACTRIVHLDDGRIALDRRLERGDSALLSRVLSDAPRTPQDDVRA